jgi:hypothetical protein
MGKDTREGLGKILANGDYVGAYVTRQEMINKRYRTATYDCYGPMMVCYISGRGFKPTDDEENRAFKIRMEQYNGLDDLDDLKRINITKLPRIRNAIYSLQALSKIHPQAFRFDELQEECTNHLKSRDSDGNHACNFIREKNKNVPLRNRALQIAGTYYTLSTITNTEDFILSLLTEDQQQALQRTKGSVEGLIKHSLFLCYQDLYDADPLRMYEEIITRVPMSDISNKYNTLQTDDGNIRTAWDTLTTTSLSQILSGIIPLRYGTGNKRYVAWEGDATDRTLDLLCKRLPFEEDDRILKMIRQRPRATVKSKLNSKTDLTKNLTHCASSDENDVKVK